MKNKTLSNALGATLAICVIAFIIESELPETSMTLYAVGGLGIWVFGVWSIIRLRKLEDK